MPGSEWEELYRKIMGDVNMDEIVEQLERDNENLRNEIQETQRSMNVDMQDAMRRAWNATMRDLVNVQPMPDDILQPFFEIKKEEPEKEMTEDEAYRHRLGIE